MAKHKPDWVKFLADQINALAERVVRLEQAQTNPIPNPPEPPAPEVPSGE